MFKLDEERQLLPIALHVLRKLSITRLLNGALAALAGLLQTLHRDERDGVDVGDGERLQNLLGDRPVVLLLGRLELLRSFCETLRTELLLLGSDAGLLVLLEPLDHSGRWSPLDDDAVRVNVIPSSQSAQTLQSDSAGGPLTS